MRKEVDEEVDSTRIEVEKKPGGGGVDDRVYMEQGSFQCCGVRVCVCEDEIDGGKMRMWAAERGEGDIYWVEMRVKKREKEQERSYPEHEAEYNPL